MSHVSRQELIKRLEILEPQSERPVFVAISGFGGSGKSTLAGVISEALGDAVVVPVDDFIVGAREHRSADWGTYDRKRLQRDVLEQARPGEALRYQQYQSGEWANGRGGTWREVNVGRMVIIEGCGIIHPSLMDQYSLAAWIDCSHEQALVSAKQRDVAEVELFKDDDTNLLWDTIWGPNDKAYFDSIRPDLLADVLVEPQF